MLKDYGKMEKSYYDTMEIIVSNFKLDGSEERGVGACWWGEQDKRRGKTILSLLMFGKREKLFQLV